MENLAILQPGTPASADATDCSGAQPRNEHPVFPWHGHFSFVFFAKERVPTAEKPAKTRSDAGIPEGSERRFFVFT
jgi:hypothetical protein